MRSGIIIVDHGSRRAQSNELLEEVAAQFGRRFAELYDIVEPAHMELAEPSIATAYARCVARGATRVVVCPFFLGPGKHWTGDIPRLAREASAAHPGTTYHVTMPLGLDDLILDLLAKRVGFCAQHEFRCDSCRGTIRSGELTVEMPAAPAHHAAGNGAAATGTCSTCPYAAAGVPMPAAATAATAH
jgi:sirohydrochlorin ferrochelatase